MPRVFLDIDVLRPGPELNVSVFSSRTAQTALSWRCAGTLITLTRIKFACSARELGAKLIKAASENGKIERNLNVRRTPSESRELTQGKLCMSVLVVKALKVVRDETRKHGSTT